MAAEKISNLERTHTFWKYLFPFQSWLQFSSFCLFAVATFVCCFVVLRIFNPESLESPNVLIIVGVIGALPAVFSALPGRFEIRNVTMNHNVWSNEINEKLISLGYTMCLSGENVKRYRSQLPRWLRWNENELVVSVANDLFVISGPIMALSALRKKLKS